MQPYEKFKKFGPEAMSEEELLAIMIRTGTKEKDSLALAKQILEMIPERSPRSDTPEATFSSAPPTCFSNISPRTILSLFGGDSLSNISPKLPCPHTWHHHK